MFLLNLGYKWTFQDLAGPDGYIILASGNSSARLADASRPEGKVVIFDPQLYLSGLDCDGALSTCSRLASHKWFGIDGVPDFEQGELKRPWQQQVRSIVQEKWHSSAPGDECKIEDAAFAAVQFQKKLGCSHIVLPTPLIVEREDEASTQGVWLDKGLEAAVALDIGQPLLASIAVSDTALNDRAFGTGGFLDIVVDQVSSRHEIDGVYIVVGQSSSLHPFESHGRVVRAYAYLTQSFHLLKTEIIITNFADLFGMACLGLGASGFASGASHSLRRLSFDAFRDEGGGLAVPHYYCHKIVGEFSSERDLRVLKTKNLLRRVEDLTPYSEELIGGWRAGRTAAEIPLWVESKNNVAQAHRHFLTRLAEATQAITKVSRQERGLIVRDWLEDAAANQLYLNERLKGVKCDAHLAPVGEWLSICDTL